MFKKSKKEVKLKGSSHTYDVICVGRVAQDTLLSGAIFTPVCSHGSCYEHIPLGSKQEVDSAEVHFGGNALNAAVTFGRQKLATIILTQIGVDPSSRQILDLLKKEGVDNALVLQDHEVKIPLSTTMIAPNGERAILAYKGSKLKSEILLHGLDNSADARWMYISSTNSPELLEGSLKFAKLNQIKVAFNPGGVELQDSTKTLKLIDGIDILILNLQEAANLFSSKNLDQIVQSALQKVLSLVITDGPKGAYYFSQDFRLHQPISENVKVVDRTGAGDAFSSGFVAGLVLNMSVEEALILGSRNSTSVVQKVGAQAGILRRD